MLPKELIVTSNYIYYTKKSKRLSFDSRVKTDRELNVTNEFKNGFEIDYNNSFDNLAAIKHPDGFTFSIKMFNLLTLLKESTVIDGVFQDKLALSPEYGLLSERAYNELDIEVEKMEIGSSYKLIHKMTRKIIYEFLYLGKINFLDSSLKLKNEECIIAEGRITSFKTPANTFIAETNSLDNELLNNAFRLFNFGLIPLFDKNYNLTYGDVKIKDITFVVDDGDYLLLTFQIRNIQKNFNQLIDENRTHGFLKAFV